eukprot:UN01835
MKAVVVNDWIGTDFNKVNIINNHTIPDANPLYSNGLLVEVKSSSVNPIDYKIISAPGFADIEYPKILGCDITGIVAETCAKCKFNVGDEVWGDLGAIINDTHTKSGTTEQMGAYAEYALAFDSQLSLKPKSLNWVDAGVT